jgi:hypothetical protein
MALEGTSADPADIDNLRDTLQEYEAAVAEYEPRFRDEWESNRNRLRELGAGSGAAGFDTAGQDVGEADIDSLMLDEMPRLEEDAVPIINIGGAEPVLRIEEEEEELDLAELEEKKPPPEDKTVEIEDQRAPSLLNLLKDQDLYDENPNWKGFQLPPAFQDRGAPGAASPHAGPPPAAEAAAAGSAAEAPAAEAPAAEAPAAGFARPAGEEVLAEALRDSVQAQREMISELAQELKDASRQLLARSQVMPIPMPTPPMMPAAPQPLVPTPPPINPPPINPPLEASELPRFAGEAESLETPLPRQAEEEVFDTALGPEAAGAPGAEEVPEAVAEEVPEEAPEEAAEEAPEEAAEEAPEEAAQPAEEISVEEEPGGEEPGEVRLEEEAEQLWPEIPAAEGPGQEEPAAEPGGEIMEREPVPAAGPSPEEPAPAEPTIPKSSADLLEYLSSLTEYLPEPKKADYLSSDQRLKMEYLRSRLAGKPGVKQKIEKKFPPHTGAAANAVTAQNIAATFSFIKTLASFHPDGTLGSILKQKIDSVLQKIER